MDEGLGEWLGYGSSLMLDGGWSSDEQWGLYWRGDGGGFGRFILGDGKLSRRFNVYQQGTDRKLGNFSWICPSQLHRLETNITDKIQQLENALSKATDALLSKQEPTSSHVNSSTGLFQQAREES
ncbi:hypothetical protein V6N11_017572 [Hibiscus sabdariffa]|uniref:Uncharacterized protein n=1 Tax=Hibiscus sabdariffa TaxID=183260 RepID=A0ABR2TZ51_9ROSI